MRSIELTCVQKFAKSKPARRMAISPESIAIEWVSREVYKKPKVISVSLIGWPLRVVMVFFVFVGPPVSKASRGE